MTRLELAAPTSRRVNAKARSKSTPAIVLRPTLLFAGEVEYCVDDQSALHHARSVVESQLGANVHVGDPLISAFSYKSEVGVPLAMDISSAPGFRVQALSVLIFDGLLR